MDERVEEDAKFGKNEEELQKIQNDELREKMKQRENDETENEEKETEDTDLMNWYENEGRHGLSQEATEGIGEEWEEGRTADGLTSPIVVTRDMRDRHDRTHTPFR